VADFVLADTRPPTEAFMSDSFSRDSALLSCGRLLAAVASSRMQATLDRCDAREGHAHRDPVVRAAQGSRVLPGSGEVRSRKVFGGAKGVSTTLYVYALRRRAPKMHR